MANSQNKRNMTFIIPIFVMSVLFLLLLSVSVNAQDSRSEAERAANNWVLMENAKADADALYSSTLANETETGNLIREFTDFLGITYSAEEIATMKKDALLAERAVLAKETYKVDRNELVWAQKETGTEAYWVIVKIPCNHTIDPIVGEIGKDGTCDSEKELERPAYKKLYQLVVTPDLTYKTSYNEVCYQDDKRIVCENNYRCNLKVGLEAGCESRILDNTLGSEWENHIDKPYVDTMTTSKELMVTVE